MSKPVKKSTLPLDGMPIKMRVSQVAAYLNSSEDLVIRLIRTGALAAVDTRRPGAQRAYYLINREDVASFQFNRKAT